MVDEEETLTRKERLKAFISRTKERAKEKASEARVSIKKSRKSTGKFLKTFEKKTRGARETFGEGLSAVQFPARRGKGGRRPRTAGIGGSLFLGRAPALSRGQPTQARQVQETDFLNVENEFSIFTPSSSRGKKRKRNGFDFDILS